MRTICSVCSFSKNAVEHAILGPAIHARINAVPFTKPRWKTAPFTAVFGNKQDCIEKLKVRKIHIAPLDGQDILDLFELLLGDLH